MDKMEMIKRSIDAQAEDPTLWFNARTITEAYLQQSLRWLHRVLEHGDTSAFDSIIEQSVDASPEPTTTEGDK